MAYEKEVARVLMYALLKKTGTDKIIVDAVSKGSKTLLKGASSAVKSVMSLKRMF